MMSDDKKNDEFEVSVADDFVPTEDMKRHWRVKAITSQVTRRCAETRATYGKEKEGDDDLILTWGKIKKFVNGLSEDQLTQEVMVLGPNIGSPRGFAKLKPGVAVGTVEDLCHVDGHVEIECRQLPDLGHHPEQVVLLIDGAGFDDDGNTMFTLVKDENNKVMLKGNKTNKLYPVGGRR